MHRTDEDFYRESKRLRLEVLRMGDELKGHPMRFTITSGITMNVEITKSDLKTVVSKNVRDNKFNAIKNALVKDIPGYLKKASYLCMRRLADGNLYKPYAIIDEHTFSASFDELQK